MSLYLNHFGLASPPFRITPGVEFFYEGARRGELVSALAYAIESGEGMIKVVGEVGSGKTMLCRVLMERLPKHVQTVYLAVPSLTRDEILDAIADDLGLSPEGRITQRIKALQERLVSLHAEGQRVVLIIDEAHAMPVATLEEIRLLSNLETGHDKLLQIVMFGQPELDAHLAAPNMRQLRERITQNLTLAPLPTADIGEYVDFRLRRAGYKGPRLFSPDALAVIAEASEGLSRRINIFADKTLLAAFAAGTHTVTADHARAAIADMPVKPMPRPAAPRPAWFWPVLAAAGMALAAVGFWAGIASRVTPQTHLLAAPSPGPSGYPLPAAEGARAAPSADKSTGLIGNAASAIANAPPAGVAASATTNPSPAGNALAMANPHRAERGLPEGPGEGNAPPRSYGPRSADRAVQRWQADQAAARLQQQVNAGRERVASAAASNHFVQLWAKPSLESDGLQSYRAMVQAALPDSAAWPAPLLGGGLQPRTALLLGPFTDRAAAQKALAGLPRELAIHNPQVRAAPALQAELNRR